MINPKDFYDKLPPNNQSQGSHTSIRENTCKNINNVPEVEEQTTLKNNSCVSTANSNVKSDNSIESQSNIANKISDDMLTKSIEDGIIYDNDDANHHLLASNTKSNMVPETYAKKDMKGLKSPMSKSAKKECGKPKANLEFRFGVTEEPEEGSNDEFVEPYENIIMNIDGSQSDENLNSDLRSRFLSCVHETNRKTSGNYTLYNGVPEQMNYPGSAKKVPSKNHQFIRSSTQTDDLKNFFKHQNPRNNNNFRNSEQGNNNLCSSEHNNLHNPEFEQAHNNFLGMNPQDYQLMMQQQENMRSQHFNQSNNGMSNCRCAHHGMIYPSEFYHNQNMNGTRNMNQFLQCRGYPNYQHENQMDMMNNYPNDLFSEFADGYENGDVYDYFNQERFTNQRPVGNSNCQGLKSMPASPYILYGHKNADKLENDQFTPSSSFLNSNQPTIKNSNKIIKPQANFNNTTLNNKNENNLLFDFLDVNSKVSSENTQSNKKLEGKSSFKNYFNGVPNQSFYDPFQGPKRENPNSRKQSEYHITEKQGEGESTGNYEKFFQSPVKANPSSFSLFNLERMGTFC